MGDSKQKRASFRDILRDSFPVDVDGLLEGTERGSPSEADTVVLKDTVISENTVSPQTTAVSPDTVFPENTVSPQNTAVPQTTDSLPDAVLETFQVEITSHFFRMDIDVFDVLAETQNPYEQLVYHYLYRYSYGLNSQTCFVGVKSIMDRCQMSKSSVRRTLDSLEQKGHIKRLDRINERDQKGTVYRVFLPCEIPGLQSSTTFFVID